MASKLAYGTVRFRIAWVRMPEALRLLGLDELSSCRAGSGWKDGRIDGWVVVVRVMEDEDKRRTAVSAQSSSARSLLVRPFRSSASLAHSPCHLLHLPYLCVSASLRLCVLHTAYCILGSLHTPPAPWSQLIFAYNPGSLAPPCELVSSAWQTPSPCLPSPRSSSPANPASV